MNTKTIKVLMLSALFTGAWVLTGCDTGTNAGDTNKEDSDHVEEGSMTEGHNSDNNPVAGDTANLERHYDDAEGAVHAGDGKRDGTDRGDVDNKE